MTAHIFPQKRKRQSPELISNSFQSVDNSTVLQADRARKNSHENSKASSTSQFRATSPLTARAKTGAIFVKKLRQQRVYRCHPARPQPRLCDEKLIFVTNLCHPTLLLHGSDLRQREDCRGRHGQFSSRIFPIGDSFPDPLLIAVSFIHLDFSYRTILQW